MIKRRFVIGAAGLAAFGGGGVAYAVGQGSAGSERQAFLNDVAGRLHVSPSRLKSAIQSAYADRLDAAVKAGKLTQAQADAIKKRVQQNGGAPFLGPRGGHALFAGPGGPFRPGFDAAAGYLGLTADQLHTQLESGKSLADIARAKNKDLNGLKAAIKSSVKTRLDTAVKNKRITQSQENQILSGLDSKIDDLVQQKGGRPPHFRERGMHRFGGPPPGGPPPGGPPPGPPGGF
ncbi:MAG: hypothetical protein ACJ77M_19875 [Thermoleophilaceae bacterium]